MSAVRHFLRLRAVAPEVLRDMVAAAVERKRARAGRPHGACDDDHPLADYALALMFEKSSTRTRYSFLMAMHQLGGRAFVVESSGMQIARRETLGDTAGVLSRYVDALMIRSSSEEGIREFARHSAIPVINGLCSKHHPCQVMADVQTMMEHRGEVAGQRVVWLGSCGNVCNSWVEASVAFGFEMVCACPPGYEPDEASLEYARQRGGAVEIVRDARAAVRGANVVVTDTWHSMNDAEDKRAQRVGDLSAYQVNAQLMALADADALFMHCMPAYRGEEVSAEVIDGKQSVVFDEAENRVHAQKEILLWSLLGDA